jgi:hypothetical protein
LPAAYVTAYDEYPIWYGSTYEGVTETYPKTEINAHGSPKTRIVLVLGLGARGRKTQ